MKKADWILIGVFLCMACLAGIFVLTKKDMEKDNKNIMVCVEVEGEVIRQIPITEMGTYSIPTKDGDSVFVIEDGACYMKSAHCKDQICVRHKKIAGVGESIICLPYKVIIYIVGSEDKEYDN